MKKLVIIGGHGNGTVVASTVEDINSKEPTWKIIGFLNDDKESSINGYPVIGGIDKNLIDELIKEDDLYFYWSLISVKLNHTFISRLEELEIPEDRFATIIHPTAVIAQNAQLGYGVSIHPFVNIGTNVIVGNHIHIFAQAMVGHGAKLENYSYVANNASIGAHVTLKKGAYLGTNATTLENISLGEWSVVGLGSAVLNDVDDYSTFVGNPARKIK